MSVSDCIKDADALPVPFEQRILDALDLKDPNAPRHILAHAGSKRNAEHILDRLRKPPESGAGDDISIIEWIRREHLRVVCTGHSLGAGIAAVLALLLKAEPGLSEVHYVGFEPPGGLFSEKLWEKAKELKWLCTACSCDWVPRLSLGNLEDLFASTLEDLQACDRSKAQILCLVSAGFWDSRLLCLRWTGLNCCLSRLLNCLGGGHYSQSRSSRSRNCERALGPRAEHEKGKELMLPPGRVVYFEPESEEWLCCWLTRRNNRWTAKWVDPAEELSEIVLSSRAVEVHVPRILEHAFQTAHGALLRQAAPPQVEFADFSAPERCVTGATWGSE